MQMRVCGAKYEPRPFLGVYFILGVFEMVLWLGSTCTSSLLQRNCNNVGDCNLVSCHLVGTALIAAAEPKV